MSLGLCIVSCLLQCASLKLFTVIAASGAVACYGTGVPDITDSDDGITDSESDCPAPADQTSQSCNKRKYEKTVSSWQTKFKHPCPCAQRRQDYVSCFSWFLAEGLKEYTAFRLKWRELHKMDQDRTIFDQIRQLALSQQVIGAGGGKASTGKSLSYCFMGQHVCRGAFASLFGAGWWPRLSRILQAVLDGSSACPLDQRFMECRAKHQPTASRGDVYSYRMTLYESVAETMPDDGDSDFDELADDDCDVCDASDITVSAVNSVDKTCATAGKHEVRHMPPGSIFEQWRQFKELGFSHGYKLFWSVWKEDFDFLKFRGKRSHGQCSICVSRKLLIR